MAKFISSAEQAQIPLTGVEVRFQKAFEEAVLKIALEKTAELAIALARGVPGEDGSSRGFGPPLLKELKESGLQLGLLFARSCADLINLSRLDADQLISVFSLPVDDMYEALVPHLEVTNDFSDFFLFANTNLGSVFGQMIVRIGAADSSRLMPFRQRLGEVGIEALLSVVKQPKWLASEIFGATIPTATGFVKIDHNGPAVAEATAHLHHLADQVEGANDSLLEADERKAVAEEIRILARMLQERVIRLAQIQFAISERGTLGYVKGAFKGDVRAALVSTAIALLLKALGFPS